VLAFSGLATVATGALVIARDGTNVGDGAIRSGPDATATGRSREPVQRPGDNLLCGLGQPPIGCTQIGFSAPELVGLSTRDLNRELDGLKQAGASTIRFDLSWQGVQGAGPQSWNWSSIDAIVNGARKRGMASLPIIDYTPAWARPAGCTSFRCAPADPRAFASFAATVVNRYAGAGIQTWEIWNEPNRGWGPRPDPVAYAALLSDTSTAIRAVESNALVLVGGLSPAITQPGGTYSPQDFLSRLYQLGARGSFGGVAVHPYTFPALPGEGQSWNGWTQMDGVYKVMVANGDAAKGVWATEFGAPTNGPGAIATVQNRNYGSNPDHVDLALQAQIVTAAFSQARQRPWLRMLMWHNLFDIGTSTTTNENWFGLLSHDGSPKPAYGVWLQQVADSHRH
jgi:polysaccharide biosynthesis protein PslG